MAKFDKMYVHFLWDDELEGKEVFYSDSIMMLVAYVNGNIRDLFGTVSHSNNPCSPFNIRGNDWKFVYYDPLYDLKVANEQGKVIQKKHRLTGEWIDILAKNIDWKEFEWNGIELRVKPEDPKPVTNRELAKWLAMGNGQIYHYDDSGFKTEVKTTHGYHQEDENCNCNEYKIFHCKIRKWGDPQWVTPSREYMGLED